MDFKIFYLVIPIMIFVNLIRFFELKELTTIFKFKHYLFSRDGQGILYNMVIIGITMVYLAIRYLYTQIQYFQ